MSGLVLAASIAVLRRIMPDLPLPPICERDVVDVWRQRVQAGTTLHDSNGESLTVVYPGRPNDGRGGDFRDAVIISARGFPKRLY